MNRNEEEADAASIDEARCMMKSAQLGSQDIPQFDLRALPNQPELAAEEDPTALPATVKQGSTDSGSKGRRSYSYGNDAEESFCYGCGASFARGEQELGIVRTREVA